MLIDVLLYPVDFSTEETGLFLGVVAPHLTHGALDLVMMFGWVITRRWFAVDIVGGEEGYVGCLAVG